MPFKQLIVRTAAAHVPAIESLLEAAGAAAVSLADAADTPVLEPAPGETPLWPDVVIKALFDAGADLDALCALVRASFPPEISLDVEPLADSDWQSAGQRRIVPHRIGPRLWLTPAEDEAPEPGARCVRLHMGLAFGTGEHPTTRLCLDWLGSDLAAGSTVLDYGCGSGVLVLAALAAGAVEAWAVDNDPQALAATRRNAALNRRRAELWVGPPEDLPDVRVDVVLANILAQPLIDRAAYFAERLRAGGLVVLSGVLAEQRAALVAAYDSRFEDLTVAEMDGWLRIVGRKRPSS